MQTISNTAFTYTVDPVNPNRTGTTNTANTQVNSPNITTTKAVDKAFTAGATIPIFFYTYTINPADPDRASASVSSNPVKIVVFPYNFSQQIMNLTQSVALKEAALENVANSEGAKIQALVDMRNIATQELLCLNKSVADMLESISMLENILK